jgi:LmbE family N-acetylglucosaminyl deacetylase
VPEGLPPDTLIKECQRAVKILGIPSDRLILLDYEVRTFAEHRQEILENLIEYRQKIQPELVLVPSSNDTHQDHMTVYWETLRALKKKASIWGYEHPWNNLSFTTDIFVKLKEQHLATKLKALKNYESQNDRSYFSEKYIRSLALTRGLNVDWQYAETFELVRLVL